MKAAERKMAEELMALTLEAIEKTGSYISFQISDYGPFIHICSMENGFRENGDFDGWFTIPYSVDEITQEMQEEAYAQAKNYLENLIRKAEMTGAA